MPAVLVTGPTVTQDLPFFPSGGLNHSQYSYCLPAEGWLRLSRPACLVVCWWFNHPKTVTHPGTNQVWLRATSLSQTSSDKQRNIKLVTNVAATASFTADKLSVLVI